MLSLFICALIGSKALSADTLTPKMLLKWQSSYKAAEPKIKRDLVIKAIDDGTIKRGLTLANLKELFGEDLQTYRGESSNSVLQATVFFEPVIPAPNPMMSALRQGWYIDLIFSSDGRLEYYSLSNLHK